MASDVAIVQKSDRNLTALFLYVALSASEVSRVCSVKQSLIRQWVGENLNFIGHTIIRILEATISIRHSQRTGIDTCNIRKETISGSRITAGRNSSYQFAVEKQLIASALIGHECRRMSLVRCQRYCDRCLFKVSAALTPNLIAQFVGCNMGWK